VWGPLLRPSLRLSPVLIATCLRRRCNRHDLEAASGGPSGAFRVAAPLPAAPSMADGQGPRLGPGLDPGGSAPVDDPEIRTVEQLSPRGNSASLSLDAGDGVENDFGYAERAPLWRRPEGLLVGWVLSVLLASLVATAATGGACGGLQWLLRCWHGRPAPLLRPSRGWAAGVARAPWPPALLLPHSQPAMPPPPLLQSSTPTATTSAGRRMLRAAARWRLPARCCWRRRCRPRWPSC
jgi:hypothetical protein